MNYRIATIGIIYLFYSLSLMTKTQSAIINLQTVIVRQYLDSLFRCKNFIANANIDACNIFINYTNDISNKK